eukprot:m.270928 g.270928  ORF g.270928 m.270928 type:complete len:287 (+) comp26862_c5_seq6:784-1644(+)
MKYVTALTTWCRIRGLANPRHDPDTGLNDDSFFAVCHGLKKKMGIKPPTRYPVTIWHLTILKKWAQRMLPRLQSLNIIAATQLAFVALLRIGEFTSEGKLNPLKHAQRADVTFLPNQENPTSVQVRIKVAKGDQFRHGSFQSFGRAADPSLCPVLALKELFDQDPQPLDRPLFNFNNDTDPRRETATPSARSKFTKLCSHLFAAAGVSDMYLKAHSFRQGGASALLAAGAPTWMVKTIGRWRSDSWQLYAFTDTRVIERWSTAMFSVPSTPVDYVKRPPRRVIGYF